MKKVIALSGIALTLSISMIAFILFYMHVETNIGGFGMIFSFFGMLYAVIRLFMISLENE